MTVLTAILAAAAAAAAQAAPPAPEAAPPAMAVDEVEITARRPVVGDLQQGVLDYRPEFFTAARPATAMDMIRWLPGFTFEDTRDVRGLGGAIGNVLIDGQPPTSKTDTLQTVLGRIPSNQVERIDLIVGGAPGIDMRGRAVIANVILKKTVAWKGSAQVEAYTDREERIGPWATLTASKNSNGRVYEFSLVGGYYLNGGPTVGLGPYVRRDAAGNVLIDAVSNGVARGPNVYATGSAERPFAGGKLRVNGSVRHAENNIAVVETLTSGAGAFRLDQDEAFEQAELGLRYERPLGGRFTLESQLLQRLTWHDMTTDTRRPPAPSVFTDDAELRESVARSTVRFKRSETFSLEWSAELALNALDSVSTRSVGGLPQPLPGGVADVRELRGDAGVVLTWKPAMKWGVIAAVRGEASRLTSSGGVSLSRDLSYLKPRAVVSFTPDKDTQLRVRVEREVGQINFGNFIAVSEYVSGAIRLGNPNLKPQTNWTAEAVVERKFWTGASLTLTARRLEISDAVDVAPEIVDGEALGITTNIGDARQSMAIVSLTAPLKAIGLNDVMVRGGATFIHSEVTDPTTGLPRRLSIQTGTVWDAHLVHDLPRWKLTWGIDAVYTGARNFYRPTTVEQSGGFERVNVYLEYRPRPVWTLRVELQNVTDVTQPNRVHVFGGARDKAPLLFTDERKVQVNRFFYFRARRTFG